MRCPTNPFPNWAFGIEERPLVRVLVSTCRRNLFGKASDKGNSTHSSNISCCSLLAQLLGQHSSTCSSLKKVQKDSDSQRLLENSRKTTPKSQMAITISPKRSKGDRTNSYYNQCPLLYLLLCCSSSCHDAPLLLLLLSYSTFPSQKKVSVNFMTSTQFLLFFKCTLGAGKVPTTPGLYSERTSDSL